VGLFRRASAPDLERPVAPAADPIETTDTVGNPIVERRHGRHAATAAEEPPPLPSRAEHRMLQLVAEGRVARTSTGGAAGAFWRIDGVFTTGAKAMMLDWLREEGYLRDGRRGLVAVESELSDAGLAVLEHRA
jgi:hypothetical protein